MEKKGKDLVVFFGQLPVNKPYPVIKPNENIQLQTTVNPIAITPYISMDDDLLAQSADVTEDEGKKNEHRLSGHVSGALTFVVSFLSILLLAFAMAGKSFDFLGSANISYFSDGIKTLFGGGFAFKTCFTPLLIIIATGLIAINCILSLISTIFAKHFSYSFLAFLAFVVLVVAAFYEIKFFSNIKNIGTLLDRECGWPSIVLMIIGGANLVIACISGIINSRRFIETVEL